MAKRRLPRAARVCYIYLMESAGLLKVGWSDNPARRISELQPGSPLPIRLIHAVPCPSYCVTRVEAAAHRALAAFHIRGEWHDVDMLLAVSAIHDALAAHKVKVLTTQEVGAHLAKRYVDQQEGATPIRQIVTKLHLEGLI